MDIQDLNKTAESSETSSEIMEQTISKVEAALQDAYPDYASYGDGSFTISRGSAVVMIVVRPFTETEACVECISNVVVGATVTPELMQFLLRKTTELHFGGFGLLFDDTVTYSYSVCGSNWSQKDLVTAIDAVAIISDYYDDEIVAMAGGSRAADVSVEDLEI